MPGKHRTRRGAPEEEDATQAKYGTAFDDRLPQHIMHPLTVSETKHLLERHKAQAESLGADPSANPTFQKTLDYTTTFSRYKDLGVVQEVRKLLNGHNGHQDYHLEDGTRVAEQHQPAPEEPPPLVLTRFDQAQLANLAIDSLEEAKTLIPTLATKDDDALQNLLQELSSMRKFQD